MAGKLLFGAGACHGGGLNCAGEPVSAAEPASDISGTGPETQGRGPTRSCLRCAEPIHPDATACRFCGKDLRPRPKRHRTWVVAAAAALLLAGVGVTVATLGSSPSNAEVVSSAWNCQSFQDAETSGKDTDALDFIANCAVARSAADAYRASVGKPLEYGLTPDTVSDVISCGMSSPDHDPDATATCLLEGGFVRRP